MSASQAPRSRGAGSLSGLLFAAALALGCGGKATGATGTNTNWLSRCTTDSHCGSGLSCLCGACTRTCALASQCGGLGEDAVCAPAKASCETETPLCDESGLAARVTTGVPALASGNASEPVRRTETGKPLYDEGDMKDGVWCGDPRKDTVSTQCAAVDLVAPAFYDACGCGPWRSGDEQNRPHDAADAELLSGEWLLLGASEPRSARESVLRTPDGWMMLYRRALGSGKAAAGWENWLSLSADGVRWTRQDIELPDASAYLRALAYGNERYVAVGARGSAGLIWTSDDSKDWQVTELGDQGFRNVEFISGRFYAYTTFKQVFWSADGATWSEIPYDGTSINDITFGARRLVAAGSGPFLVEDAWGANWQQVQLDCREPGNCDRDPDGNPFPKVVDRVLYNPELELFHAGHVTSRDGMTWTLASDGAPEAVLSGKWVSIERDEERVPTGLRLWDDTAAQQVTLSSKNPDGLSCKDHTCFLLHDEIVLVR